MKYATLLLMVMLLIAGCSARHSDPGEDLNRMTVPDVVGYTAQEQAQAYDERQKICKPKDNPLAPMICRMTDDYGRMRDQARAALGLIVDTSR